MCVAWVFSFLFFVLKRVFAIGYVRGGRGAAELHRDEGVLSPPWAAGCRALQSWQGL